MLARIEKVEGVEWAAVEATGRFLAVRPRDGAGEEAVAVAVERALAGRGRRAGEALARSQLAARERGDPWFGAKEAHALSYVEGRLVSVHVSARVARELGLGREAKERLAESVREVFFAVLERVHAEGGRESSGWFYAEWPRIAAEVAARMADAVPDRQALLDRLTACYARG
ncbi:MAG TPA: hypothetical protein VLT47_13885 [Anaeromyxobacteraceae bacterium]|nr:hypothetical protein [Anaeromyxobacteraceae bacterium]